MKGGNLHKNQPDAPNIESFSRNNSFSIYTLT